MAIRFSWMPREDRRGRAGQARAMIVAQPRASSNAVLTMSWLARLRRSRKAERTREQARLALWESEGGAVFHPRHDGHAAASRA